MLEVTREFIVAFDRRLERAAVPAGQRPDYRKWVRFYLDFCQKYGLPPRAPTSLDPFLAKLESKGQSATQRAQATRAVKLLVAPPGTVRPPVPASPPPRSPGAPPPRPPQPSPPATVTVGSQSARGAGPIRPAPRPEGRAAPDKPATGVHPVESAGRGASWEREYRDLEGAIKLRNYSRKTWEAYRGWLQKFQAFVRSQPTSELGSEEVKAFLTDLAVRHNVAASTQNQAFNALLFVYRHVLGREFGKLDGVVRAKRRPYVPVVLSHAEVDALLAQLDPRYRLVALLLYGCGLRLAECVGLRMHCFNLESGLLTVHDGKGQKDRTVPLPKRVRPEIDHQMETIRRLHREDLAAGYAGVFLPRQLEKKYKHAARELIWQWFFPAPSLTRIPATGEKRRYHVHESHVQHAIKQAATRAGIPKRVSPHTFRHTFASHLLLARYDLPTIQRLLGHGDIKTTMIYLQTVPSQTLKEARSPLDLESDPIRESAHSSPSASPTS